MPIPVHPGLKTGVLENTVIEVDRQPSPTKRDKLGDVQNYVCTKGGGGGQLGAILCKLFRLEVYIKRGEGVKNLVNMQT